ncbi:hypothetical protein NQ317_019298 [Molorchus minor]|uniref:MADF domain-containing protein n=1 Tax=Molorchus minor TaxID=1323400 RepID=A0ABQ9J6V8_9CUCU|nr:hypothetical protein NQ317_019298 [Molorchus minor]
MDWSNETVFKFLECYENEPVIWNASLPNHKNRNDVCDAWKRIEVKMGQKYTVTELKKKKDSLMASFRACLNKEILPQEDGNNNYEEEAIATVNMEIKGPERDNVENKALVLPSTNKHLKPPHEKE